MSQDIYISVQPVTGEDVYINVSPNLAGVLFVNGRDGIVVLNKSDVGLSNVENISITGVSGYLQYQIDNLDTGYASQAEINLLSGLLGQTGAYLYTTITNLSGDIISNYTTKIELGNTGLFLQNLVNTLSGYSNGTFATITNVAATGLNLSNQIDILSGYSNNAFATILNLASTGQNLQNQINNLDLNYASQTEFNSLSGNLISTGANLQSQINSLYGSGFLTGVDLSPYYLKSNPSGFITGVDLSNYATLNNLELTGQNLQNQINNLDNVYATDSSLTQTGQFLDQKIDTFSGTYQNFVNNLDTNYASQSEFNTLSGNLNSTGQNLDGKMNSLSGAAVLVYGNQTISGIKNFIDKPRYQNSQIYIDGGTSLSIAENQIVYVPQFDNYNAYNVTATLVYISSSGLLRLPTGVHNLSAGQEQRLNIRLTGPGMAGGTFYIQNPMYGIISGTLSFIGWQNIYQTKVIDYTSVINLYKNSNSTTWQLDKNYSITNLENQSQYFVNTTGNQAISGTKIFRDQVYIKDLYVTGTETIVNTINTNVASNYILLNATGGSIDAGIFIVTGSGLTGISDTGAVIGYDVPANRWVFGNTSRGADLSQLDQIAGITDITNYSGFVSSNFYSVNNPNGYITGIENIVYTTGDQSITGYKIFTQNISTNQINGIEGTGYFGNQLSIIGTSGAGFGGSILMQAGTGPIVNGSILLNSPVTANRGTNKTLGWNFYKSGDAGTSIISINDSIFKIRNGCSLEIDGARPTVNSTGLFLSGEDLIANKDNLNIKNNGRSITIEAGSGILFFDADVNINAGRNITNQPYSSSINFLGNININKSNSIARNFNIYKTGTFGNETNFGVSQNSVDVSNKFTISGVQVIPSSYYTKDNPSGFITQANLNQASGNLQSQIDILNVNSIAYAIALG